MFPLPMKPMILECNRLNIITELLDSRLDSHEDIADRETVYHTSSFFELHFLSQESYGECLISGLRNCCFMIAFPPVGAVSFSCTPAL